MDLPLRTSRSTSRIKMSPSLGLMQSMENLSPAQRKGLPRSPSTSSEDEMPRYINTDRARQYSMQAPLPSPAQTMTSGPLSPGARSPSYSRGSQYPPMPPPPSDKPDLMRPVARGAPGDAALAASALADDPERLEMQRRRSKYYETAFASREHPNTAAERVGKDSVIMAEIKTNVIVNDEYTFITDMSAMLSLRYQRPESCIFVVLQHSACILFAGSFDPTYMLTVTGLPTNVQPTSNKRNAIMLQTWMQENLGVETSRGCIKFVGVQCSDLAIGGKTLLAQQEAVDKELGEENSKSKKNRKSRSQSVTANMESSKRGLQERPPMPPTPKTSHGPPLEPAMKKRKSLMKLFGKG